MGSIPPPRNRRVPGFGFFVFLAIVIAVIAFGLFKRRGARKPPPIPAESSAPGRAGAPAHFAQGAESRILTVG